MTKQRSTHSIGSALLYFGIFLAVQTVVTAVATVIAITLAMMEVGTNPTQLQAQTDQIMQSMIVPMNLVGQLLALGTVLLIFAIRKRSIPYEIGMEKPRKGVVLPLAVAVLFGIGLACTLQLVFPLLPIPEEWMQSYMEAAQSTQGGSFLLTLISTVIAAPIVEEVFMRGLIYTRLKRRLPTVAALLITSAVFGLLHGDLLWIAYTFVIGALFNLLFLRTGWLGIPIAAHFGFNLCGGYLGMIVGDNLETLELILVGAVALIGMVGGLIWLMVYAKDLAPLTVAERADSAPSAEAQTA